MSKSQRIAVVAVVALALLIAGGVSAVLAKPLLDPARPPASPVSAGETSGGPAIPSLTSAEQQQARGLILKDQRIQAMAGGNGFRIVALGVWHTQDLKKIGAAAKVEFDRPLWIETDWPVKQYDSDRIPFPHYEVKSVRQGVEAAGLHVNVDLQEGRVVSIVPLER